MHFLVGNRPISNFVVKITNLPLLHEMGSWFPRMKKSFQYRRSCLSNKTKNSVCHMPDVAEGGKFKVRGCLAKVEPVRDVCGRAVSWRGSRMSLAPCCW